jgi:hypothetical protein
MKKILLAVIAVVVLAGAVLMVGCDSGQVKLTTDNGELKLNLNTQSEGIWVTGNGKVTVTPDVALLSVGVEVQDITVADAQAKASEAMDGVIAALKDNGVKEEDIQTQQFNIRKVSEWEKPIYDGGDEEVIIGYVVTNVVTAKVKDIETVGAVIDAVAAAGGDYTRIDSIGFTVDDPMPYYEDARAQAVEYAKAKAEQLAELGGVTLGQPTYISENTYYSPNYVRSDMAMEVGSVPAVETSISPGELEITASVQMAFDID